MTKAPKSASGPTLSDLPYDVLRKICRDVDVQTARSLCTLCSATPGAGESVVWQTVDITSGGIDKIGDYFGRSEEDYRARARIVDSKLQHAVTGLIKRRHRLQYISTLRLEPSDGKNRARANRLIALLEMVAPRLKRLDVLPVRFEAERFPTEMLVMRCDAFNQAFQEARFTFPMLVHLKVGFEESISRSYGWIPRMQNLQEVEVCSGDQYFNTTLFGPMMNLPLPQLRRLTVHNIREDTYDQSLRVMEKFINIAPKLSCLRMEGEWRTDGFEWALRDIAKHKSLKTLVIKFKRDDRDMFSGSLPNLPSISFEKFGDDLGVEEVVLDSYEWHEWQEISFKSVQLPRAANLQRLAILTTPRMPLSTYADLGLDPSPVETCDVPGRWSLDYIRESPALTSILFLYLQNPLPSPYGPHFIEPDYFPSPSTWVKLGHRGMVIRQYTTTTFESDGELWHIRALSRALSHPDAEEAYIGPRRCWQDFTHYKGMRVPRGVLKEVYAKSGQSMEFVEGGRNLEMCDAGWEVLRDWWLDEGGDQYAEPF